MTENKERTNTEAYNHGYIAGYNQHRVDVGEITQKKADKLLQESLKS